MTFAARIIERLGLGNARHDAFAHRLETLMLSTPDSRRGPRRCPTVFGAHRLAA